MSVVPFASPVVDWATLGKVVAAALVVGIGVTAAFGSRLRRGPALTAAAGA